MCNILKKKKTVTNYFTRTYFRLLYYIICCQKHLSKLDQMYYGATKKN